jgi:hypothetical protein
MSPSMRYSTCGSHYFLLGGGMVQWVADTPSETMMRALNHALKLNAAESNRPQFLITKQGEEN